MCVTMAGLAISLKIILLPARLVLNDTALRHSTVIAGMAILAVQY